jgi:hypothetical protein
MLLPERPGIVPFRGPALPVLHCALATTPGSFSVRNQAAAWLPTWLPNDSRSKLGKRLTCQKLATKDRWNSVEPRGFEPLTPSMRTQCATGQTGQVTASAQVSGLRTVTITAPEAA